MGNPWSIKKPGKMAAAAEDTDYTSDYTSDPDSTEENVFTMDEEQIHDKPVALTFANASNQPTEQDGEGCSQWNPSKRETYQRHESRDEDQKTKVKMESPQPSSPRLRVDNDTRRHATIVVESASGVSSTVPDNDGRHAMSRIDQHQEATASKSASSRMPTSRTGVMPRYGCHKPRSCNLPEPRDLSYQKKTQKKSSHGNRYSLAEALSLTKDYLSQPSWDAEIDNDHNLLGLNLPRVASQAGTDDVFLGMVPGNVEGLHYHSDTKTRVKMESPQASSPKLTVDNDTRRPATIVVESASGVSSTVPDNDGRHAMSRVDQHQEATASESASSRMPTSRTGSNSTADQSRSFFFFLFFLYGFCLLHIS